MAIRTQLSTTATPGRRHSFVAKGTATGAHDGEFTELSTLGVPGQRHSFSAKTPAGGGTHTGTFTQLGVDALPGQRHAFSAKTPAGGGGTHTGTFTYLQPYAVPGKRRTFVAKSEAIVVASPDHGAGSSKRRLEADARHRLQDQIRRDDEEILFIIAAAIEADVI